MKKYVIMVKIYDKKYQGCFRCYYKDFENYRELRDYVIKYNFKKNEYIVFEETDIKFKRERDSGYFGGFYE
jgi:hypothetical protein